MTNLFQRKPTIDILNTHASVLSSKYEVATAKYNELFSNFIKLFKESGDGYDDSYLDGSETSVTVAYWAFSNCQKKQKLSGSIPTS
jgi:hypothetical protein